MHEEWRFIREEKYEHNDIYIRYVFHIHHTGSCQCIKACDCSSKKGEFIREVIRFTYIGADVRGKYKKHFATIWDAIKSHDSLYPYDH